MKTMKIFWAFALMFVLYCFPSAAQETAGDEERQADKFATVTVAVLNSDRPYHVVFIKYFDKAGDILLNTTEEFKINISKSPRFSTGSIRKTIPVYADAHLVELTVSNCTNMHENRYLISEFEQSGNEATFVFSGNEGKIMKVQFDGIQKDKPCAFNLAGANTNLIFYADYDNVQKEMPDEAHMADINVKVSETSLHPYKIVNTEEDAKNKTLKIKVEYMDANAPANPASGGKTEEDKKKKKK